jgi:hypothetical protein
LELRVRRVVAAMALVASVAACTSSPPPSQPPSTATAPPSGAPTDAPSAEAQATTEPTDCRERIQNATFDNEATIDALEECRFAVAGADAARDVLLAGGTRDQLWAAIWIYGSAAFDPVPLAPMLHHDDSSIRVMAAAAAVAFGDRQGFAPLSDALADESPLAGARPPTTVGHFAAFSLTRYINAAGTPPAADAPEDDSVVAAAWRAWLTEKAASLQYDDDTGEWSLP